MDKLDFMYFAGVRFGMEVFVEALESIADEDGLVSIDSIKKLSSDTLAELMVLVGKMKSGPGPELLELISQIGRLRT